MDVSKRVEEIDLLLVKYESAQDVNELILTDQFANSNPEIFARIYKENKRITDEIYKLKQEKEGLI